MKTDHIAFAAFMACRGRRVTAHEDGGFAVDIHPDTFAQDAREFLNGATVHANEYMLTAKALLDASEKATANRRRIQYALMRWELSGRPTSPTIH